MWQGAGCSQYPAQDSKMYTEYCIQTLSELLKALAA
jgi:hypothetical protein